MFTKRILPLVFVLIVSALMLACSPKAADVSFSVKAASAMGVAPSAADSLSTIEKFHTALKARDSAALFPLLANDIVLIETKPAPCRSEMANGIQAVEQALKYSHALSFSVQNVRASGEQVTYRLTEWMDPRVVGPNYPQPVQSNVTAVVQDGQIVSITAARTSQWMSLFRSADAKACW